MEEEGISQISVTDKESKLMRNNGKYEVCYNNQTAVDMETHITVAYKTDNNPADVGSMSTLMEEIKREYEVEEIITNTTDAGYKSIKDMMECLEMGVIPQVTPGEKDNKEEIELETEYEEAEITEEIRKSKKREDIKKCLRSGIIPEVYEGIIEEIEVKEERKIEREEEGEERRSSEEIREEAIEKQRFERDINKNIVYCPSGESLCQKSTNQGRKRYANKLGCKKCKNPCTKSKYKIVDFREGQKTVVPKRKEGEKPRRGKRERRREKVVKIKLKLKEENLKRRMQTSEHSQGTMKTVDNHRDFHMRGKTKVSTEIAIYFTASNIRRVSNMIGVKEMKEKIEKYFTKYKNNSIILNINKDKENKRTMKELISFELRQLMVRLGGGYY